MSFIDIARCEFERKKYYIEIRWRQGLDNAKRARTSYVASYANSGGAIIGEDADGVISV